MAQFIVVGLGNFGSKISLSLSELGDEVLAIDIEAEFVDDVKDAVSQAVIADATEKETLAKLISSDFDAAIVSLGDKMEASVLVTLYLKELGVRRIIVKANNEDHGKVLKAVGATEVIYPEAQVALSLAQRLHTPNLIEHIPLAPEYSIVEIVASKMLIGKTLRELQFRQRYGVAVIAVKDVLTDNFYLIPDPDFMIKPDNALIVVGMEADIKKLQLSEDSLA